MVVGRTDHLSGGAAPNWVSPKQGLGLMARYAVILPPPKQKPPPLGSERENFFCSLRLLASPSFPLVESFPQPFFFLLLLRSVVAPPFSAGLWLSL